MTAGAPSPAMLLPSHVAELLQTMVKALRAFQMYLPNNPIHQRSAQNVKAAFGPIWTAVDELTLAVGETELRWEEEVVYSQLTKPDCLAWMLFKDGMRVLTIRKGAEQDEIVRFLELLNHARFLPAEAGDDLMTLLWEQDFQLIQYHFIDLLGEAEPLEGSPASVGGTLEPASAETRRAQVAEEAPPRPKGIVDIEDFDSTLYFLEEAEINYIVEHVQEEYRRDARQASLNALFDLLAEEVSVETETVLTAAKTSSPWTLTARTSWPSKFQRALALPSGVILMRSPFFEEPARIEPSLALASERRWSSEES